MSGVISDRLILVVVPLIVSTLLTYTHDTAESYHIISKLRMIVLLMFEQYKYNLSEYVRIIKARLLRYGELTVNLYSS